MKITLSETLIDSLMSQSPETAMQVIATCRELIKLDNDAIEQYQLSPDAPQPLHDIVNDMKKRAAAARRRRQRREAKVAAAKATNTHTTPQPANQKIAISPTHLEAINLLFSNSTTFSDGQMEVMHQFIQFIIGRLTTPTPTPKPTHRPRKKKPAKPQPLKTPAPVHNTYKRTPISQILKKRP